MRKIFGILPLAAAMIAGCAVSEPEGKEITSPSFYASFEEENVAETRTYVDDKLTMRWTKNDEISIFVGNTLNQEYKYSGETGANSGSFTPLSSPGFVAADPLTANYAVYPYISTNEMDVSGKMTLTLPAVQDYAVNTFGLGANTMVAATENKSDMLLQFKNLCGYFVLRLYGNETIKSITFEGNNGEKIAGKATVSAAYGSAPSVAMADDATTSITLDCGAGVKLGSTAANATEFWFCIPPTTFSKGFTITATNNAGLSMQKSITSSKAITRNVKVAMSSLKTACDARLGNVEFEDANFKAYCVENFDKDGDGEISMDEAEKVVSITVDGADIKSLKGIEYFTQLKSLDCSLRYSYGMTDNDGKLHYYDSNGNEVFSQLTSLDVSKNTALTILYCSDNQLTSLDVSKNTALTRLYCRDNQITSLDVSKNTALTELNCDSNQLTSLDVSKNTALTYLVCSYNQLTSLDVSKNTALTCLHCSYNQLTGLDISKNTKLRELDCRFNQLTSLDVSNNTYLTYFCCNDNQLSTLDVSKNTDFLSILGCGGNQLTSLDVSNNTALISLDCSGNHLISLDVSKNTALTYLVCSYNQLTSLDVSKNTALTCLHCSYNQLTGLDISKNTKLRELDCRFNQLTSLDVSNNTYLTYFCCNDNQLSTLDVSKNTDFLSILGCGGNQLTSLDVSNNTALISLDCSGNHLISLDVSKNTALTYLDCSPMATLRTLYIAPGQSISRVTTDRSNDYLPEQTEIVEVGQAIDLSASGTANCYIISAAGYYKFKTVQGNTSTSVGFVSSAEVLWETFGTSTKPNVGDLVNTVSYTNGCISFMATGKEGNAVIAAKNASGKILWSWHIWCTDKPSNQVYKNGAGTMMDRNLGATSATPGNVGALGLLYQWGRKDPFIGSSEIQTQSGDSSNPVAMSTNSHLAPVNSTQETGTIEYAIQNPMTPIMCDGFDSYDWLYSTTGQSDATRWSETKTKYDPCPFGWKVPDSSVWTNMFSDISYNYYFNDSSLWNYQNRGCNFGKYFGVECWFPAAGEIDPNSAQYLLCAGRGGDWWTSTSSQSRASCLDIWYDANGFRCYPELKAYKSSGYSVRCVKE